jgi:uncharacterized membrane protein YkvA (DUF1232 family)
MGRNQQAPRQNSRGSASGPPQMGPWQNLRFTWRMLRDPRVAPYAKVVLPILALVYLISPIDLIPDMILGLGQVDDIGVLALVAYFLVSYVKRAGWATLLENGPARAQPESKSTARTKGTNEDIIDAQYRVIPEHRGSGGEGAKSKSWGNS